ncbi:hypothetical protein EDB80DRAFT_228909 [Ilyonectria destructans]|nr:hypothetical protein EDB80DRAFT_228909 [Ilyonectria destructans]
MHPKSTPQGLQDDLVSIVCARCGEKKPAGDFVSKRKSAGNTKNCLECRSRCNSHIQRRDPDIKKPRRRSFFN